VAYRRIAPGDYRALADFRYEIRRFLRFSEEAARGAGLEPQQHQLLLAVTAAPPGEATVGYLSERLQLRHHSVVGLIDRLEEQQLVVRKRSGADRRNVLVCLTPRGKKILGHLTIHHREELKSAIPALMASLAAVSAISQPRRG
jgi:DNA-binding MarR family transcriptional regulator